MIGQGEGQRRRGGASLSRAAISDRYRAWLQHHRLSAADSLAKVLASPGSSILTWLVIAIALALPVGLNVALENLQRLSEGWDSPAQMSAFLTDDVSTETAQSLAAQWRTRAAVADATVFTREQALEEFSELSGFADVVASLQENPLPDIILITPDASLDDAAVATLSGELAAHESVTEVVLDMAWLQRLNGLMELGQRFVLVLGAMLLLGVLLILGNTIRLAIESRRDEIVIIKLVGGSNAFVRRPFLYTGLWYGVGGGLLAGLLVAAALWYLREPVATLAALYESSFTIAGPGVMGVLNLVIVGGMLGLAGAWLSLVRHLAAVEPE